MHAVFLVLILKFQSVISVERTSTFWIYLRSLKGLELTKFAEQIFENTSLGWSGSTRKGKYSSHVCANCVSKKCKYLDRVYQDSTEFQKHCKVMNVISCHLSCQCSAMLWWTLFSLWPIMCCHCWSNQCCEFTWDRMKLVQSPYFFHLFVPML